jgi:hypothetical protein
MKKDLVGLGKYECHKTVHAARILAVKPSGSDQLPCFLTLAGADMAADQFEREVPAAYLTKHQPEAGGYFVVYEDGYTSYSPKQAFEGGYTLVAVIGEDGQDEALFRGHIDPRLMSGGEGIEEDAADAQEDPKPKSARKSAK